MFLSDLAELCTGGRYSQKEPFGRKILQLFTVFNHHGFNLSELFWGETYVARQTECLAIALEFVHPESPPLKVTRREQQWNYILQPWAKKEQAFPKDDPRNFEPTKGNFATAWFDHGSKPDTTECVYTLVPETTPEAMGSFAKEMAKNSNQSSVNSRRKKHLTG